MSFWISRLRCNVCGSECNISGGMIGMQWMGPIDSEIQCPNPNCNAQGFNNFTTIVPNVDIHNTEHLDTVINNNHIDNGD